MTTNHVTVKQQANSYSHPFCFFFLCPYALWPTFEGSLSTPENVNFSNQLEWKPPYYTMNQESDVIHVDPHITHYTVYTIDVFTGRMFGSVNVTETSFAPTNNMPRCPMHQVSAWNAGGEGELSELIQNSIPQSKDFLKQLCI